LWVAPSQSVEPPSRREKKDVHLSTVQWPLHAHLITKKNLSVLFILFFSFSLSTPGWEEAAVDPGSNSVAPLIFIFCLFHMPVSR
jgi:hypothetical protein